MTSPLTTTQIVKGRALLSRAKTKDLNDWWDLAVWLSDHAEALLVAAEQQRARIAMMGLARRKRYADRRAGLPLPRDVRHGIVSTYTGWGCRCDLCRAANTAKANARNARLRAARRGTP